MAAARSTTTSPIVGSSSAIANENITISGAMSFESLYLVNGVVVTENIRRQPMPLYIEDALEETRVMTGSIGAQYGRFTGGVVNAITKSGGNQFEGSVRASLTNDDWVSRTPLSAEALERCFDPARFVENLDRVFERVFDE